MNSDLLYNFSIYDIINCTRLPSRSLVADAVRLAILRNFFADILRMIAELRLPPPVAGRLHRVLR